jgi:hypothetical protein
LVFVMYGGADCLWHLLVGVNVPLYVATECFCTTTGHSPEDDPVKVEICRLVHIYNLNVYVINLLCYRLTRLYILHRTQKCLQKLYAL